MGQFKAQSLFKKKYCTAKIGLLVTKKSNGKKAETGIIMVTMATKGNEM